MRILYIPHAYTPVRGGTEIQCQRVAEVLASQGHTVRVVTADVGSVESYYRFGIPPVRRGAERLNSVDVIRIPFGGWLYTGLGATLSRLPPNRLHARLSAYLMRLIRWRFTQNLAREIRRFTPSVVVTLPHLVVNVQAVLRIHRRRPFPLVMLPLLHEEDPHWDIPSYSAALAQATAVLANTEHERRRLVQAYGIAPDRVFVGGNGVDLPEKPPEPQSESLVLFLGRKVPGKGIASLIEAMRVVWPTHPETPLVLAGARGADTTFIDRTINALPLLWRVCVKSPDDISEQDKLKLLARARCLVLPSKVESFGVVLLEAWAQGVPVITLDLPVFHELVAHGRDGLRVKPDDPAALAAAIVWMLDHPDAARAMGQAGLDKVKARFTWNRVAARFLAACDHAASSWKACAMPEK